MDELDLNLLPVFDALLRHRRVGRAAADLGMSQPGFSYALKRLRKHFGDPLFVRTPEGMMPTDTANRIAPVVGSILSQTHDHLVPSPAFAPATSTRTFTLMMSDLGELIVLPKLLRALATLAPSIQVRVQSALGRELPAALQSGQVDLAIGFIPGQHSADIYQQRLYAHGFVCMARKGHPKIKTSVDRETFASLQHASIRSTGYSQQLLERCFEKHGVQRTIRLQTPNILSVPFIVAATDVVVTVPAAVGELFGASVPVQTFEPPVRLPRITVRQFWHRGQHSQPGNRWLRELVNTLFSGPEGWRLR